MADAISSSETSTIAQTPELIIATPCSSGTRTAIPSAKVEAEFIGTARPASKERRYAFERSATTPTRSVDEPPGTAHRTTPARPEATPHGDQNRTEEERKGTSQSTKAATLTTSAERTAGTSRGPRRPEIARRTRPRRTRPPRS